MNFIPLKRNSLCIPSILLLTFYEYYTLWNKLNHALPLNWEYTVSGIFTKNFIWRITASRVKLIVSSVYPIKTLHLEHRVLAAKSLWTRLRSFIRIIQWVTTIFSFFSFMLQYTAGDVYSGSSNLFVVFCLLNHYWTDFPSMTKKVVGEGS